MRNFLCITTYILQLNGSNWTGKLPYSISDTIVEKSITDKNIIDKFNELSFDIFVCWSKQQNKHILQFIHPNLIHYLMDNQTKIITKNGYNYLLRNKKKLYISNKTKIAYELIKYLSKIDLYNKYFDGDNYTSIEFIQENYSPFKIYTNNRVICKILINDTSYHGIEIIDSKEEFNRVVSQPKMCTFKDYYINMWYIYKDNWNKKTYQNYFLEELNIKFSHYYYIRNKKEFKIDYMAKSVDISKKLSCMFIDSYENKEEYLLSLDNLMNELSIQHNKIDLIIYFKDVCNRIFEIQKNKKSGKTNIDIKDDDLSWLLDDLSMEESDILPSYTDNNINHYGLYIFTRIVNKDNFNNLVEYLDVIQIYNKIGRCAVESIKISHVLLKQTFLINNSTNFGLNINDKMDIKHPTFTNKLDVLLYFIDKEPIYSNIVEEEHEFTNKLHKLNGYNGKPELFEIDGNHSKKNEFLIFSNKNNRFTTSTQILSPNLIRYFIINNAAVLTTNGKFNYLTSTLDNTKQIEISNQIRFLYEFIEVIIEYKNTNKNSPFHEWFDVENNVEVICENIIRNLYTKKITARVDFTFAIKNIIENRNFYYAVEFMENNSHMKEENNLDFSQHARKEKIKLNNNEYGYTHYISQSKWNTDDYKLEVVKEIEQMLIQLKSLNLENQNKYAIEFFDKYLLNKKTSTMIIKSYSDEFNHILE